MIPTKSSIIEAHQKIKEFVHHTPLLSSTAIANKAGCKSLYLKCENFQKIGAFKTRGAANRLRKLDPSVKTVCTHSSGNHAQALAYISSKLGIKAHIVMPQNSPNIKVQATMGYGATVTKSGNTMKERMEKCEEVKKKYNAVQIPPFNDYDIIEGQATVAKEVFEDSPVKFDYIVFPIGGGGLASGTLLSTKYFGEGCKAVGVEPYLARDSKISVEKGQIQPQFPPITVADGLRGALGDKTFPIIKQNLTTDEIILVDEEEIIDATKLVLERMKILIEPSSATVVAAILKDKRFQGKNVCCIITGGNIDMSAFFDSVKAKL